MRRFAFSTFACAALFAVAGTAQAQTIGFKLGASLANIDSDAQGTTQNSITGFAGGGFIRFGMGRIGFQPELLSVTKGTDIGGGASDIELRLEYVEIPVLLHLALLEGGSFSPYVFGGPTIAFEVGCSASGSAGSLDCDNSTAIFDRNGTDFGVAAGGGLAFAAGPGSVLFEGRYTWGLSNINAGAGAEARNRAALLLAGYAIPIGRRY